MVIEEVNVVVATSYHGLCQCQKHNVSETWLEILIGVIDAMICMYQTTKPKGTSDEQEREEACSILSIENTKEKMWSSNWQSREVWSLEEVVFQIRGERSKNILECWNGPRHNQGCSGKCFVL